MSKTTELRPFSKLSPDEDPQNVAALIRSAQEVPEEDFPRLRWRLRADLRQQPTGRGRLLRMALVAGGMFLTGGMVGAVMRPFFPVATTKPSVAVRLPEKTAPRPVQRKTMTAPTEEAPPELLSAAPIAPFSLDGERLSASHRRPLRMAAARLPTPPLIPEPAPPPEEAAAVPPASPIAVEQALLADALASLRRQHDSRRALALLEDHARRFPETVLAPEAAMLRAEALLGLGRNAEALAELDQLSLAAMPKAEDRLVLRGELRAVAGRWREALTDFETQLSVSAPTALAPASLDPRERALWGRASARSHLGDDAGARDDLRLYLRTFPSGRFAARAASLLREGR